MHQSQVFFRILLGFLFGVALASFFNIPKEIWLAGIVIIMLIFALSWRKNWGHIFFALALLAFVLGGFRAQGFSADKSILSPFADQKFSVTVRGYISDEVENKGITQNFSFTAKKIKVPGLILDAQEKILITTEGYPKYEYGDFIEMEVSLKKPQKLDDFDYPSFLARDGIFTTASFPTIKNIEPGDLVGSVEKSKIYAFSLIFKVKDKFEASIQKSISEPNASFINGILLGSRSEIPQELKDNFSKTGLTHILAISGYNITIIAAMVSWIFLLFLRRQTAFWFSVIAIFLFTILTGASASVVRASIMGVLILTAFNVGRLYDSRIALALAAGVMVWFNPFILRFDAGFQLSFLATIGILYVVPVIKRYTKNIPELFNFKETAIITISAQLMVLPLILFYFNKFSIMAIPVNLLVLPIIPFTMLFGFMAGIAGLLSSVAGVAVGSIAWLFSSVEIWIASIGSKISFGTLALSLPWYGLLILYGLIYILFRRVSANEKQL